MGKARRRERDVSSSNTQEESKQYLEATMLESTTPEYKLREIVLLPDGVDYNEWLASHTIAFFDHINLIYGTISEFCTMSGCPDMVGPGNRQYFWVDERGKRIKLPSPQYIDYVMTFTQKTVNDESIFPTKFEKEFPSSFESIVRKILRLLFHVLAHIYHSHFKEIVLLRLHSHLNCIFAHLVIFNDRFKLIDDKEIEVLQDLAVALKLHSHIIEQVATNNSTVTQTVTPATPVGNVSTPTSMMMMMMSPMTTTNTPEPMLTPLIVSDTGNNVMNRNEQLLLLDDEKMNVITTQCRSVSPFLNDPLLNKQVNTDEEKENDDKDDEEKKRKRKMKNESREITPFKSQEVPLCDNDLKTSDINSLFSKDNNSNLNSNSNNNNNNNNSESYTRRSISASAVPSSRPKYKTDRRSNSSGTSPPYHSTVPRSSICGMDSVTFFTSSSVPAASNSPLRFQ